MTMSDLLRTLCIGDSEDDVNAILQELSRAGFVPLSYRVERPEELQLALEAHAWELVIAARACCRIDLKSAVDQIRGVGSQLPVVVIGEAGTEDLAGAAFGVGARDYLCHGQLSRLAGVVRRELGAASISRQHALAQQRLRASESRYCRLLDSTSEGIAELDLHGYVIWCNAACVRLLGYANAAELIWRKVPFISQAALSATSMHAVFDVFQRKDGTHFPVEYRARPLRERGTVLGTVITFLDIGDRQHGDRRALLQRADRDSRPDDSDRTHQCTTEHLRAVVSSLPIAVWAIDQNGRITLSEGHLVERLGYSSSQLVGQSVFELYRDSPDILDVISQALAGEVQTWTVELHGVTMESRYVPIRGKDGTIAGAMCVTLDVSERRHLEEQLRQAHKMEAVGRLAAGVAHDFNNLLTAIIGFGELALHRLAADDPSRPDVQQIVSAGHSAACLTRQLLAFGRKQILQPQIIDINDVVGRMEMLLRRTLGEDVRLMTRLAPACLHIHADPNQIEQVLMNLAVNARDAMPQGGTVTIETGRATLDDDSETVRTQAPSRPQVVLTVTDTGVGMSDAVRTRLFEPFFTTKEAGKGTGLGLASVQGIVEQSGGTIHVTSRVGVGTTFRIFLPEAAPEMRNEHEHTDGDTIRGGAEAILLVEDQAEVRAILSQTLALYGYTILEASGGDDALRIASDPDLRIDMLLTDIVMPGMNGHELAQRLTVARPSLRVLYASGYTDDAIVRKGVLTSGIDFIQKPFSPGELMPKVRSVLDA